MISVQQWDFQFRTQANWTSTIRQYLFRKLRITEANKILEVGSGTGVILSDSHFNPNATIIGLDINYPFITFSKNGAQKVKYTCGNGKHLPFQNDLFDFVFCHYLLLWIEKPEDIITEMKRVTRSGGKIIAFAEPDYGGRIDYPEELTELGRSQEISLANQGADTRMGRKLFSIFNHAGLKDVNSGVIGGEWSNNNSDLSQKSEWNTLSTDLKGKIRKSKLDEYQVLDMNARKNCERILYVPTFYAWGIV